MCLTLLTAVLSWPQFLCGTEQLGQISFTFVRRWAIFTYCIFSPLSLFKSLKDREGWVWSKNHCVHVHNSQRIKILKSVILVNVLIHINMEFTAFWRFTPRDILYYIALLLNDFAVNEATLPTTLLVYIITKISYLSESLVICTSTVMVE